jgi:hypothetical protein
MESMDWILLAQDRNQVQAVLNKIMTLLVHWDDGNFRSIRAAAGS